MYQFSAQSDDQVMSYSALKSELNNSVSETCRQTFRDIGLLRVKSSTSFKFKKDSKNVTPPLWEKNISQSKQDLCVSVSNDLDYTVIVSTFFVFAGL